MDQDVFSTLKGALLIAMPELEDPNFSYTVTCICDHTEGGSFGVLINRLTPVIKPIEIFKEFHIKYNESSLDVPVYVGGPVQNDEIFILHGPPFHWDGAHQITETLALTNTLDVLEAIAVGKGPESFIITLGCAGWEAGQLENELLENFWLTCPADSKVIFDVPADEKWSKAVESIGFDPLLLSSQAGHA